MEQASTLMGVSTRHTRRILAAYRKEGEPHSPTVIEVGAQCNMTTVLHLARTRYSGTNHTHMSELLSTIDITRSTLRRHW